MPSEKIAIFWIDFEARHVVGRVEVRGIPEDMASFLHMSGFVETNDSWTLTVRKGLQKRWEDRVAGVVLEQLWWKANFYEVTRWLAGNVNAYTMARPDLRSQMRYLELDALGLEPAAVPKSDN